MPPSTEPQPPEDWRAFSEAVEDVLANYLPEEVRADGLGDNPTTSPIGLDPLQMRALRQAGIEPGQIEVRIIRVEVDQIRREIERLERTVESQGENSITEGQVYLIALGVLAALVAMVALLSGKI